MKWDLMSRIGNKDYWLLVFAFQILFLEFDEWLQIFRAWALEEIKY